MRAATAARVFKRVSVLGDISPFWVSEGGLEPPRRCCITDSVMYHHFKVARRRCPARQLARRVSGSRSLRYRDRSPGRMSSAASPQLDEEDREGCHAASSSSRPSSGAPSSYDERRETC